MYIYPVSLTQWCHWAWSTSDGSPLLPPYQRHQWAWLVWHEWYQSFLTIRHPHIEPLFRQTASDPTDSPVLTRGPTISIHNFPCHNDPDTHMHLLGISARDEGNHDNQHPRVCVFWAHDCAACRCSSGASARKSIRIWASNHLKPSTIDQAQQTFSFVLARLLPTCPTVRWGRGGGDGWGKDRAFLNAAEA